jgi:hypothetical protein
MATVEGGKKGIKSSPNNSQILSIVIFLQYFCPFSTVYYSLTLSFVFVAV